MTEKGIAAYRQRQADREAAKTAAQRPKVNRFALESGGDSVTIRFAQEIDVDAKNYSSKRDIGFVNIEHNHPDPNEGWKNRANCSLESQGACLPCEFGSDASVEWNDRKGWKQKEKFYINVIGGPQREVEIKGTGGKTVKRYFTTDIQNDETDFVYLLEQGTYNGIWDALLEYALDDETITENYWKIKRKGDKFNDTSYILTKGDKIGKEARDIDSYELYNIEEDVLKDVPYAQQRAFYFRGVAAVAEENKPLVSAGATTVAPAGDEW